MTDANKQLIEARRMIAILIRACRQTSAFFDGVSAMDQIRMKRMLRDTIRQSEQFMAT